MFMKYFALFISICSIAQAEDWPHWQEFVNRDRVYDFYAKEAEYFRKQKPPPELLAHYRAAGKLKDVDGIPEIPFVPMAIMNALGAHGVAGK